jgi:hypothetical protein
MFERLARWVRRRRPSEEQVRQAHAEARAARDEDIRRMTPGERVELAYRLSTMQRELK